MAVDQVIIEYTLKLDKLGAETKALESRLKNVETQGVKSATNTSKSFDALGNRIKAALTVGSLIMFTNKLIEATSISQKFGAVLANSLGSQGAGQKAFGMLANFAAKTPFQLNEITEAFIKMVNRGFKPTEKELTKLGDLAASQGKSIDQFTEAILDAQTGEFERLKEFGIRASKANGEVTLSFKGQTIAVKDNDEAIRNAILGFGEMAGVAGSMAVISATTEGKISNLKDGIDALTRSLGDGASPVINEFIDGAGMFVSGINEMITGLTPLADGLRENQAEFNAMIGAVTDGNVPMEQRSHIIEQLNIKYGEYLPNMLDEKSSMEDIQKAAQLVNVEMERRILIMAKEETLTAILKKQADEIKKQAELRVKLNEQALKAGTTEEFIKGSFDAVLRTNMSMSGTALKIAASEKKLEELKNDYKTFSQEFDSQFKDAGIAPGTTETDMMKKQREAREKEERERKKANVSKEEAWKAHVSSMEKVQKIEKDIISNVADVNTVNETVSKLNEKIIDDKKATDEIIVELNEEKNDKLRQQEEDLAERRKQLNRELLDASVGVANELFNYQSALRDADLSELESQKEKGLITEDEYAKQVAEIKRKQAEADRNQALFNIAINTAQGVMSVLSTGGGTAYADLGISAGVLTALVIATGAIQAAAVLSQPIPEFAKGVVGFKGKGTGTSDSNLAKISAGESVITAEGTKYGLDYLEALNEGPDKFRNLIYAKDILPALKAQERKFKLSTGENMVNSMKLNGMFDTYGLERAIKGNKTVELGRNTTATLLKGLKNKTRSI